MKKILALLLCLASAFAYAQAVPTATRNLGTDPVATSTLAGVVSCNLYRGTTLVVNAPLKATGANSQCYFTAVVLSQTEAYTATYQGALFESDPSGPFATGTKPTAPGSAVHIVP